jgi:hypothetical protein
MVASGKMVAQMNEDEEQFFDRVTVPVLVMALIQAGCPGFGFCEQKKKKKQNTS